MESIRKAGKAAAAVLTAMLGACATPSGSNMAQKDGLKPVSLSITQVGADKTVRYVYCDAITCPGPTIKTMAQETAVSLAPPTRVVPSAAAAPLSDDAQARPHVQSAEIAFPFNSSRMSQDDRDKLVTAASTYSGADVEITSRSDFVGPPKGQRKIVEARAQAMRSIVAQQTHGARIAERQEIAGPDRVTAEQQSQQRQGTVRFIQPTDDSQKGESK